MNYEELFFKHLKHIEIQAEVVDNTVKCLESFEVLNAYYAWKLLAFMDKSEQMFINSLNAYLDKYEPNRIKERTQDCTGSFECPKTNL